MTNDYACAIIQTDKNKGDNTMRRELKYIRYRICRSIYYADQCPTDNKKNYNAIGNNILSALGLGVCGLVFMALAVVLA